MVDLIALNILLMVFLILVSIFVTTFFTFVNTLLHEVPNQDKIVLVIPLNAMHQDLNVPLIRFHTLPNTSFTPSHAWLQSPVNIPMNISKIPVKKSNALLKITPI